MIGDPYDASITERLDDLECRDWRGELDEGHGPHEKHGFSQADDDVDVNDIDPDLREEGWD
jgi:hypothetical protein